MSKLTTASVLAFERKLDISDGVFYQKNAIESQLKPLCVSEKSVRGVISNRLKNAINNDPAKLDTKKEDANLQKVDAATLDEDNDTLVVKWSCKVLPFTGQPYVCNNQEYQQKLKSTVEAYISEHGFAELAKRYAINILNGRWLWRNRVAAEKIKIDIAIAEENEKKK